MEPNTQTGTQTDATSTMSDKLHDDVSTALFQGVLLRVADQLSDAQKEELNVLLQSPNQEVTVPEFLKKNIPNIAEIVKEEADNFQKDAEEVMKNIQ